MAITTLLKLAGFTNDLRYVDIAHQTLAQMQGMMSQYPLGFGQWLQAPSFTVCHGREIAINGELRCASASGVASYLTTRGK